VTTTITGRNRYSDEPLTRITIREPRLRATEVLVIEGGYIEARNEDTFLLAAKHLTAKDVEDDSCYVAYIEGAGLKWKDMVMGDRHVFTGVILKASFYPDAEAEEAAKDRHGRLPFGPTDQPFKPGVYEIEVQHLGPRRDPS
jgi:hypothetical protein